MKVQLSKTPLLLATAFLVIAVIMGPSQFALAQSETIALAQSRLNACFEAAKQAEVAGANINSLQETLNDAGALLSKAQAAQSQGDTESANNYAQQAQSILSGFEAQANAMRDEASRKTQTSYLIVLASTAGTFIVLGVSIAIWMIQKRRIPSQGD